MSDQHSAHQTSTLEPPAATPARSVLGAVRRRLPKPVKRGLRKGYESARLSMYAPAARAELLALKREYRRRYGPGVIYTVDPRDEMLQFMKDFWFWQYHVVPMRAPSYAMRTYLVSGELMLKDLEGALRDHGRSLPDLDSFLEFASGYGRFTRFLIARLDRSKVTVSDISRPAVDFARRTYGVSGFYSTEAASDLMHDKQYDVVFVASLFSHLAIEHWGAWLQRLSGLVAPGGLLVFSTHGSYARDVIYGESWRDRLQTKAPGFQYLLTNETHGRLAEGYYGSAFVTEDFVRGYVTEHGLGTIKTVYPAKLWGSQDLYVLEKPPTGG